MSLPFCDTSWEHVVDFNYRMWNASGRMSGGWDDVQHQHREE